MKQFPKELIESEARKITYERFPGRFEEFYPHILAAMRHGVSIGLELANENLRKPPPDKVEYYHANSNLRMFRLSPSRQ